jgi:hypothetical protein
MAKKRITTEEIERENWDNPTYWAARLIVTIKDGNAKSEQWVRCNLRRLGFDLVRASETELSQ